MYFIHYSCYKHIGYVWRGIKTNPRPKNSTAPGPPHSPPVLKFLDPPLSSFRLSVVITINARAYWYWNSFTRETCIDLIDIYSMETLQRGKEWIVLIVRRFEKLDNDIYYYENIDWIWATYAFPFSLYPKHPLNWTYLFDQLGNLNPSREVESGKFYGFLPIFCQFNCFQKMLTEAHGGKSQSCR